MSSLGSIPYDPMDEKYITCVEHQVRASESFDPTIRKQERLHIGIAHDPASFGLYDHLSCENKSLYYR